MTYCIVTYLHSRCGLSQIFLFGLILTIKAIETAALPFIKHLCQSTRIRHWATKMHETFTQSTIGLFLLTQPFRLVVAITLRLFWFGFLSYVFLELRQDILLAVLLGVFGICSGQAWLLLAWSHISRHSAQKGLRCCDGSEYLTESWGRMVHRKSTGKSIISVTVYCGCCLWITQNQQKAESLLAYG